MAFLCNWCAYEGADSAGRRQRSYPPNVDVVRVLCSGRVDPQSIIEAFKQGADGVMVLGCHPGDCHYREGNFNALRRHVILKKLLTQFGIEEGRLKLDWISSKEADKFVKSVSEMTGRLERLGPLAVERK